MIDRTLNFVLGDQKFKTLGSSRTDKMVSANHSAFELFLEEAIDPESFLDEFNLNLPFDLRATHIEEVNEEFNIIQAPKSKEYVYLFCCGDKPHPFTAPLLTWFPGELDIELMKVGAKLFEGGHDFRAYCKKPSNNTETEREIILSEIRTNDRITASFFPETTYTYHVHGKGFMRNQIRMMIAQLVRLGRGEIDLDFIKASVTADFSEHLSEIAPASGLQLDSVSFTG